MLSVYDPASEEHAIFKQTDADVASFMVLEVLISPTSRAETRPRDFLSV